MQFQTAGPLAAFAILTDLTDVRILKDTCLSRDGRRSPCPSACLSLPSPPAWPVPPPARASQAAPPPPPARALPPRQAPSARPVRRPHAPCALPQPSSPSHSAVRRACSRARLKLKPYSLRCQLLRLSPPPAVDPAHKRPGTAGPAAGAGHASGEAEIQPPARARLNRSPAPMSPILCKSELPSQKGPFTEDCVWPTASFRRSRPRRALGARMGSCQRMAMPPPTGLRHLSRLPPNPASAGFRLVLAP